MYFSTVAIVGVGLLGGSIGLALQKRQLARRVIGIGRNEAKLIEAENRHAVTEVTTDLAQGVADADLVIICTPVETVVSQVEAIAKACKKGTLITDVGSTKGSIVAGADKVLADGIGLWATFVGSHPMAGSEKTGVLFAKEDLFVNRAVIVTPSDATPPEAKSRIEAFWQALGARTITLPADKHDELVAFASHVPHLVASALAASTPADALPLVAGGWLDSTRIAAGDIELWRQILSENRSHTLLALTHFEKVISSFRAALESGDQAQISRLLRQGKTTRDSVGN